MMWRAVGGDWWKGDEGEAVIGGMRAVEAIGVIVANAAIDATEAVGAIAC